MSCFRRQSVRATPQTALRLGALLAAGLAPGFVPFPATAHEQSTYFLFDIRADPARPPLAGRIPLDAATFDAPAAPETPERDGALAGDSEDSEFVIDYDEFGGSGNTGAGDTAFGDFGGGDSSGSVPEFSTGSGDAEKDFSWNSGKSPSPFGNGGSP